MSRLLNVMGLLGVTGQLLPNSERRLVMNAENPADRSHPHSLEVDLTRLLEGWIFASS